MGQQGRFVNLRVDRRFVATLVALAMMPVARAGGDALEQTIVARAPMEIPHTVDLLLADLARKRNRKPDNIESYAFLDLTPGLNPVVWPQEYRRTRASPHPRSQEHAAVRLARREPVPQQGRKRLVPRARSRRRRIRGVLPLPPETVMGTFLFAAKGTRLGRHVPFASKSGMSPFRRGVNSGPDPARAGRAAARRDPPATDTPPRSASGRSSLVVDVQRGHAVAAEDLHLRVRPMCCSATPSMLAA